MPSSLARAFCYSSLDRAAETLPEHQWSFTATTAAPLQLASPPAPSAAAAAWKQLQGCRASAQGPGQTQLLLPKKLYSFGGKGCRSILILHLQIEQMSHWQGFLHRQLQLCLWNSPQLLLNFPHLCHHAHKEWGCATAAESQQWGNTCLSTALSIHPRTKAVPLYRSGGNLLQPISREIPVSCTCPFSPLSSSAPMPVTWRVSSF